MHVGYAMPMFIFLAGVTVQTNKQTNKQTDKQKFRRRKRYDEDGDDAEKCRKMQDLLKPERATEMVR